jgi:rhodanese-related sulfurtransferase
MMVMRERGYDRVAHLRGGIDAWSREVDPSVPRY